MSVLMIAEQVPIKDSQILPAFDLIHNVQRQIYRDRPNGVFQTLQRRVIYFHLLTMRYIVAARDECLKICSVLINVAARESKPRRNVFKDIRPKIGRLR